MTLASRSVTSGPSAAVKRVGVVGGGTMGNGIAQTFATAGFEVALVDVKPELVERALATIGGNLERVAKKQSWAADRVPATLQRIRGGVSLEATRDCQVVVEAVSEDFDLKRQVFEALDRFAPAGAVLATNTSSISITEIAAVTQRPERVIGMHFMNPPPLMKLIELVRAVQTTTDTYELIKAVAQKMGKTVITSKDVPGFLVNRMLIPMIGEACFALQEGLGTPEDIDLGAKLGLNHPMGPLELADLIGLDTCLFILEVLQRDLGDDKYRAPTILRNLVAAGWYGKKTGRGFYVYDEKGNKVGRTT